VIKGVFTLDRPLTLSRQSARAGVWKPIVRARTGIPSWQNLSHSSWPRWPASAIDFERLFQRGRLDPERGAGTERTIYSSPPPTRTRLRAGRSVNPGVRPSLRDRGAYGHCDAGGFADKAFKSRVLVVARSLERPQTFVSIRRAIPAGEAKDFELQPEKKDIVYVS